MSGQEFQKVGKSARERYVELREARDYRERVAGTAVQSLACQYGAAKKKCEDLAKRVERKPTLPNIALQKQADEELFGVMSRLVVAELVLRGEQKETRKEYKLRRVVAQQKYDAWKERQEVKKVNAERRLRFKNRYWPMYRLGLVESDALPSEWAFPHWVEDPMEWYEPEKAPARPSRQARALARSRQLRAYRKFLLDEENHHLGKKPPTPKREARKFSDFIATTNWVWDRWTHTLTWAQDPRELVLWKRAFVQVGNSLLRAQHVVKAHHREAMDQKEDDDDEPPAQEIKLEAQMDDIDPSWFYPEMDAELPVQGEPAAVIHSADTVEATTAAASSATHVPVTDEEFRALCGECKTDTELATRSFPFERGVWKTSDQRDTILKEISLPQHILTDHADQPNFAYFNNHRYWSGDMEISVKLNANERFMGQLMLVWNYQANMDLYFKGRKNVCTGSQNMHCLISANQSNEGKLYIPFRYVKPYLDLKRTKTTAGNLVAHNADMGTMMLIVLVPLAVASGAAQSVDYSLHVTFQNSCFTGTVSRNVVIPQMLPMLIAMEAFKRLNSDNNRDLPADSTIPAHMKHVTAANWAVGTGQSRNTTALRLNPGAVLPYGKSRAPDVDEMQIDYVTRTFGLFKQIKWTSQSDSKTKLVSFEACPLHLRGEYLTSTVMYDGDAFTAYHVPPVGVVTSMFRYWRGDLEIRFDIVAGTEICGKLLVAFVPNNEDVDFDVAIGSNTAIVDIRENRSFTFVAPYIADKPWQPRREDIQSYVRNYANVMGRILVFVENKLIPNPTIPDYAMINIYIRGGRNFEVAVPTTSILSMPWECRHVDPNTKVIFHFKTGYWPVYVGQWRMANVSQSCILRYGNTTDHVVQFDTDVINIIVSSVMRAIKAYGYFRVVGTEDKAAFKAAGGMVDFGLRNRLFMRYVFAYYDGNYAYAVPMISEAKVKGMCKVYIDSGYKMNDAVWSYAEHFEQDSGYFYQKTGDQNIAMEWVDVPYSELRDAPQPQMDERFAAPTLLETVRPVPGTGNGALTFGERFSDFKDIIRRTELYSEETGFILTPGNVSCVEIPIRPQGLPLNLGTNGDPNLVSNFMRYTNRQIIASGYRYFAGSMCIKIKCSNVGRNDSVYVQHCTNAELAPDDISVTNSNQYGAQITIKNIIGHGDSTVLQDTANCSIFEVDVPFYQPGTYGLLQRGNTEWAEGKTRDMKQYTSLGYLKIGVAPGTNFNDCHRTITTWAAAGDDMRFFTFQGFPPMRFMDASPKMIAPTKTWPKVSIKQFVKQDMRKPRNPSGTSFEQISDTEAQMWVPFISDMLQGAKNIKNASEKADAFVAQLAEVDVKGIVDGTLTEVEKVSKDFSYFSCLYNAISNMVHCIINPAWQTIAWAVASMFQFVFQLKDTIVTQVTSMFRKMFSMLPKFKKNMPDTLVDDNELEAQMDNPVQEDIFEQENPKSFFRTNCAALCSLLISGMMTYLGYNAWKGKYDNRFIDLLFKLITTFTSTANGLLTFFRGTIDCLLSMFDWCVARVFPEWDAVNFLAAHDTDLYKWCKEAQMTIDPRQRYQVFTNPEKISRLYTVANEACLIQQKIINGGKNFTAPQLFTLRGIIDGVMKLRDQAANLHIAPPVKFEPFVLQVSGESNIGKSFMIEEVTLRMLEHIGYRCFGEPKYVRCPGNEYWNGLMNQPILIYDDFMAVASPDFSGKQIAELFQLKTRCVFNPPMAAVEDKNIRYNPLIVAIGSNMKWFSLTGVMHEEAVHRRRDMLVEAVLKKGCENAIRDGDPKVLENFGHLEFIVYNNPADRASSHMPPMDYPEFQKYLFNTFAAYYARELARYKATSARLFRLAPQPGEKEFKFANHATGETIDEYYQRKADPRDPRDALFKTLMVKISSLPRYKKNTLEKMVDYELKILKKAQDSGTSLPVSMKSEDHPLGTYTRAYAQVKRSTAADVMTELQNDIMLLRQPLKNGMERKDFAKMMVGQMEAQMKGSKKKNKQQRIVVEEELIEGEEPEPTPSEPTGENVITYESVPSFAAVEAMERAELEKQIVEELAKSIETNVHVTDQKIAETVAKKVEDSKIVKAQTEKQKLDELEAYAFGSRPNPRVSAPSTSYGYQPKPMVFANPMQEERTYLREQNVCDMTYKDYQSLNCIGSGALRMRDGSYKCVHEAVSRVGYTPGMLIYHKDTDMWTVGTMALCIPTPQLLEMLPEWRKNSPSLEYLGAADLYSQLHFSNKHCEHLKCPFRDNFKKLYFIQRYIENEPSLFYMQECGSSELAEHVPAEFLAIEVPKVPAPQTWMEWIQSMKDKIMTASWGAIFKVLGYMSAIIGTLLAIYTWFSGKKEPENVPVIVPTDIVPEEGVVVEGQSPGMSMAASRKLNTSVKGMKRGRAERLVKMQLGYKPEMETKSYMNEATDESISSVIRKNTVFITAKSDLRPNLSVTGRCFGLVDRFALVPSHYHDVWMKLSLQKDVEFYVHDYTMRKPARINYEDLQMWCDNQGSMAFVKFPPNLRQFRDARSRFMEYSKMPEFATTGTLYELKHNRKTDEYELNRTRLEIKPEEGCSVSGNEVFEAFNVPSSYSYNYGGAGVCGSVLLNDSGKILGIHVAGSKGGEKGLAERMSMEDIRLIEDLIELNGEMDAGDAIEMQEDRLDAPPDFGVASFVGYVHDSMLNTTNVKSTIRPSPIRDLLDEEGFESKQEPAVLSASDPRIADDKFHPLSEGVKHHGNPMYDFPGELIEQACEDYEKFVLANCKPHTEVEPTTLDVAIVGQPGVPYYDSIDMTTSAGWPWRCGDQAKAQVKSGWIKLKYPKEGDACQNVEVESVHDDLMNVMCAKKFQRLDGKVPFTVFADILKDETLPKAKAIRKGGTRIISMSPLDFTLQQRQYTLAFVAAFMKNRLDLEHAIGINPDSDEWTTLFSKLVQDGREHYICADYSKFGDKLPVVLGKFCFKLIGKWYRHYGSRRADEVEKTLQVMGEEVFSCRHICNKYIYETMGGMPSGNTMTVILNSMVNSLFMRIAWLALTNGTGVSGIDNFYKYIKPFSYGDDLVVSVDRAAVPFFDTIKLRDFFAKYNMKFTDADKEGEVRKFRQLKDLIFLQRSWLKMPSKHRGLRNLMLAPIQKEIIEEVPYWVLSRNNNLDGAVDMVAEAMRLAFTRGPRYYKQLAEKYTRVLQKKGRHLPIPDWEDVAVRTYEHQVPLLAATIKFFAPKDSY